jgi:CHAT domain-containing protein
VNDRATEELMSVFYQKLLKEKLTPAAALRQAQTTMAKSKQWSAPYYWAAFVQQGEWR